MEVQELMPLQYILKATSQDSVREIVEEVNNSKRSGNFPTGDLVEKTIDSLRKIPNQQQATDVRFDLFLYSTTIILLYSLLFP